MLVTAPEAGRPGCPNKLGKIDGHSCIRDAIGLFSIDVTRSLSRRLRKSTD
jgi:hypothetical protein